MISFQANSREQLSRQLILLNSVPFRRHRWMFVGGHWLHLQAGFIIFCRIVVYYIRPDNAYCGCLSGTLLRKAWCRIEAQRLFRKWSYRRGNLWKVTVFHTSCRVTSTRFLLGPAICLSPTVCIELFSWKRHRDLHDNMLPSPLSHGCNFAASPLPF